MAVKKQVAVRLVAEGGKQVKAELEGVGKAGAESFRRMTREVDLAGVMIKRLAGIAAAAFSIRKLAQYTDTWSELADRVDLVTGAQERTAAVMDELYDISRRTLSPIADITDAWLRNERVLREMGLTTSETLQFTESLSTALDLSAIRGQRAEQMYNALSRAMAVGKLKGVELNTVIANGGMVAEILADALGTTVSGLRKAGQEGKITADVIQRALIGRLDELKKAAEGGTKTFRDGMEVLDNAILKLVGTLDRVLGASSMVGSALVVLADNLGRVASSALVFAGFMAGKYVMSLEIARTATTSLTAALGLLRVALIRVGIGAIIVAFGEVVFWLGRVASAAESVGDGFRRMYEVGRATLVGVGQTAWGLVEIMAGVASLIVGSFLRAFAEIAKGWDLLVNGMAAAWNAIADSKLGSQLGLGTLDKSTIGETIGDAADGMFAMGEITIRQGGQRIVDAAKSVGEAVQKSITKTTEDAADSTEESMQRILDALDDTAKKGAGKAKQAVDRIGEAIRSLTMEAERLRIAMAFGDLAADIWARQTELGVSALSQQGQLIDGLMRQIDAMKRLKEASDRGADALATLFSDALTSAGSLKQGIISLIAEIARMQLMKGFTSLFGAGGPLGGVGTALGGLLSPNAMGGVYASPGLSAYSGQIVSQPTVFPFARGIGLMGEAGPEAILPLKRGRDGRLGVEAGRESDTRARPVEIVLRAPEGFSAAQVEQIEGVSVRVVNSRVNEYDRAMPARVRDIQTNKRRR